MKKEAVTTRPTASMRKARVGYIDTGTGLEIDCLPNLIVCNCKLLPILPIHPNLDFSCPSHCILVSVTSRKCPTSSESRGSQTRSAFHISSTSLTNPTLSVPARDQAHSQCWSEGSGRVKDPSCALKQY
nr:hypothetical protein Iba_chr05aCG12370 [Ipomoea batatas]GMD41238.1 hypothetical protein Iba_chr10aCG17140 [Ipomoea batatas]